MKDLCGICSPLKLVSRIRLKKCQKYRKSVKDGVFRKWGIKERFPRVGFSPTKWSVSGAAGLSVCQPSSTTLCVCVCSRYSCITCKDLVRFASSSAHPPGAAYYILDRKKNQTCVSHRGTKILLIVNNLYVHTLWICACFTPPPGLY